MADISQISAEYKLAKATDALGKLIDMANRTPALKVSEAWVVANSIHAVLTGKSSVPDFWATDDLAPPADEPEPRS